MQKPNLIQDRIENTKEYYELLKEDYVQMFSTPRGKRILLDMGKSGFINKSVFQPGDPYMTARNEGMRTMVLHVMDMATKIEDLPKQNKKAKI